MKNKVCICDLSSVKKKQITKIEGNIQACCLPPVDNFQGRPVSLVYFLSLSTAARTSLHLSFEVQQLCEIHPYSEIEALAKLVSDLGFFDGLDATRAVAVATKNNN